MIKVHVMYYYIIALLLLCFKVSIGNTGLHRDPSSKVTSVASSTTEGYRPEFFSIRTSTTTMGFMSHIPDHYSVGSTSSSYSNRRNYRSPEAPPALSFQFADLRISNSNSHTSLWVTNLKMNFKRALGFGLVLVLSAKPWLSLHSEFTHDVMLSDNSYSLINNAHRLVIPLFYLSLNFMYYQFFNKLDITFGKLLKRIAGILVSLHYLAHSFTYQVSPISGLRLPGNLSSLLSVTTTEARQILILAHFLGSFSAGFFINYYR